jgi:hypothetical protein
MDDSKSVKILFRLFSNILDEITVETLWATIVDESKGSYKLDNIPFYLPSIACGDIVFAEFDEDEGRLTYREVVEYSGNSTVHVILLDDLAEIDAIRKTFELCGCSSEKLHDKYFAMDVPVDVDYKIIKPVLQDLENQGVVSYCESCLSDEHRY